jgi:hypothetical protein
MLLSLSYPPPKILQLAQKCKTCANYRSTTLDFKSFPGNFSRFSRSGRARATAQQRLDAGDSAHDEAKRAREALLAAANVKRVTDATP